MRIAIVCVSLAFLWGGGCSPANREQLAKEVVRADPEFADVLEKHRELSNRIETYKQELTLKRTTIQQKIDQLQKDLAAATANFRIKSAEVSHRIDPDRERLQLALTSASNELRVKREQRAGLGRQMAQVKKGLKSAGANADPNRAKREAELAEMARDAGRLDQEMTAIKQHLRLLKIKLLLIKL